MIVIDMAVYALVAIIFWIIGLLICSEYAVDMMLVGFCCGLATAHIANIVNYATRFE